MKCNFLSCLYFLTITWGYILLVNVRSSTYQRPRVRIDVVKFCARLHHSHLSELLDQGSTVIVCLCRKKVQVNAVCDT